MADEFVRRNFTRYRLGGVASLSVPGAFLRVLGPLGGAPQIIDPISGSTSQTVSAQIRVLPSFGVRVGDILRESESLRIFIVRQVQPEPHTDLLHCSEIRGPIPDEFNANIEAFWTLSLNNFDIADDEAALELETVPTGSHPSAATRATQLVKGDFDVWATVRPDAGASNQRFCLIGARDADGLGCYVGIRNNSAGNAFVRVNQTGASESNVIVFTTLVSEGFVRLKRQGARFIAFFSESEPITDADWFEIYDAPDIFAFESDDDVSVGCFGFATGSPTGQMRWQFFRNWVGKNESPTSINLLSNVVRCIHRNTNTVGNVGGGEDNLHSFSLPGGTLVDDGDYVEGEAGGRFAANENNKAVRFYVDGTAQVAPGATLDIDGAQGWVIRYKIVRLSSTSVRISCSIGVNVLAVDGAGAVSLSTGFFFQANNADETVSDLSVSALTILVTGEGVSNDDVTQNLSIIELCQQ